MNDPFAQACFNMIQQQVRPWDVLNDRALEAMAAIAREHFVPEAYRGLAYADFPVPITPEVQMLAPTVVGRLLQALDVQPGERVLEIGTGSGYITACLHHLGGRVLSLEIDPALAAAARARLAALKINGVEIRDGDALAGPVAGGPFDAIALNGSMPSAALLPLLRKQLAVGGRLFAVIGDAPAMTATLITRHTSHHFDTTTLFETCIPVLSGVVEPERFVF
ncbi:protein-L-isoaspartate O-methyltransferase family protein [Chromatium okenii]|jgi:protein-L-isoaspartate(D-aspartate) O-methyltransferase|uniref:Protein-L-isoaspartate O-methyltransferase n=1 Tax=Chromatium okenii TaxID=61644 RepID=A0A2S7XNX9_9GAMM|nr:protein-L-isoaspartate O-methyltransferase [Chromatium okenii]MBV5310641.1 protein-L-isoaspartate O-methyltransferase [Chromatium okenii]PQJ95091.1 protein-L-isoaspartate O-methyltransferase [Chromatium okenii]